MNIPRKIYEEARRHCKLHDSAKITGPSPLSRSVAFPMATSFNEIAYLEFFFWGKIEILNIRDAFSEISILGRLKKYEFLGGNLSDVSQSAAIVRALIKGWIGVFGCPRVIFKDPGPRFDDKGLGDMCENFHITLISTPARHHQSFGATERSNQAFKNTLSEIISSEDYHNSSTEEMIAIAQLINNGRISQVDGQTPGHRCFGRAPRLPAPTVGAANIFDISHATHDDTAPETVSQKFNANLIKFRIAFI